MKAIVLKMPLAKRLCNKFVEVVLKVEALVLFYAWCCSSPTRAGNMRVTVEEEEEREE